MRKQPTPHLSTGRRPVPGIAARRTVATATAGLLLASTLAALPPPAGGGTAAEPMTAPALSLGLQSILPGAELSPAPPAGVASEPASRTAPTLPGASLAGATDLAALRRVAAARGAQERYGRHGGFGRWIKRHWWVPVLVVAAGVLIADSNDNDDEGPGEND